MIAGYIAYLSQSSAPTDMSPPLGPGRLRRGEGNR